MNIPKRFDQFVSEQTAQSEDPTPDWQGIRDVWLAQLDKLYRIVEEYLKPYLENKSVKINYRMIDLNEEGIGPYSARAATVQIGNTSVLLEPIGTLLFGAHGRVDMVGPRGKVTLLVVDKDSKEPKVHVRTWIQGQKPPSEPKSSKELVPTWKIAVPRPSLSYIDLSQDAFQNALMDISNA